PMPKMVSMTQVNTRFIMSPSCLSLYYRDLLRLSLLSLQRLRGKNHANLCVNCLLQPESPLRHTVFICAYATTSLISGEFLVRSLILAEPDSHFSPSDHVDWAIDYPPLSG